MADQQVDFPRAGDLPSVQLTWYDGDKRPPLQSEHNMPDWPEATLFVGSEGMLIADYGRFKLIRRTSVPTSSCRSPTDRRMPTTGSRHAKPAARRAATSTTRAR